MHIVLINTYTTVVQLMYTRGYIYIDGTQYIYNIQCGHYTSDDTLSDEVATMSETKSYSIYNII